MCIEMPDTPDLTLTRTRPTNPDKNTYRSVMNNSLGVATVQLGRAFTFIGHIFIIADKIGRKYHNRIEFYVDYSLCGALCITMQSKRWRICQYMQVYAANNHSTNAYDIMQ